MVNTLSRGMRARAVRLVLDCKGRHGSRWQAVLSIGCALQTLAGWVDKAKMGSGKQAEVIPPRPLTQLRNCGLPLA